jgi:hypothetical protein
MTLPFHPYAEAFPLIEGQPFLDLADDIRENGLRRRIDIFEASVLDGRNRFNALKYLTETGELLGPGWGHRKGECLDADMLMPASDNFLFRPFNPAVDGDPISYVASLNLRRRDLSISARAYAAATLGRLGWGGDRSKPSGEGLSAERRAEIAGVGRATVERAQTVVDHGIAEVKTALKQSELPVSVAEKIARLPEAEQQGALEKALPKGARAIMGSRQEPADSLDYFPTPPWATRALFEHVLATSARRAENAQSCAWEPACGEGHIAEVLREYFGQVHATDIHDYRYGQHVIDFLNCEAQDDADWIITNPPFGDKSEAFVLRALYLARVGVAMFVRLQWLETNGRYERIFRDNPPTQISFFAERVNLCKGRWDPEGSTATAYIWLVWIKGQSPRPPLWIPPGCREALTRPDDAIRFTASPVRKSESLANAVVEAKVNDGPSGPEAETASRIASRRSEAEASDQRGLESEALNAELQVGQRTESATGGESAADSSKLDIPDFLRRPADNVAPFVKGAAA